MENQENHFIHFICSSIAIILRVSYIVEEFLKIGRNNSNFCLELLHYYYCMYRILRFSRRMKKIYSILEAVNDPLARFISDWFEHAWMDVKGKKVLFQFSSFLKIFNNCYIASHLCQRLCKGNNFFHIIFLHFYHILIYIYCCKFQKEIENRN